MTEAISTLAEDEFDAYICRNNHPVFVLFGADWCDPCDDLRNRLEKIAKKSKLDVVRIDVASQEAIAKRYDVRTIPVLLAFTDSSVPDDNLTGAVPYEEIRTFIEQFTKTS